MQRKNESPMEPDRANKVDGEVLWTHNQPKAACAIAAQWGGALSWRHEKKAV